MIATTLLERFPKALTPIDMPGRTRWFTVGREHMLDIAKACAVEGMTLKTMVARDDRHLDKHFRISYLFGLASEHALVGFVVELPETDVQYLSIASAFYVANQHEREIHSFFGLVAAGHHGLRSMDLFEENWPANVYPLRKDVPWDTAPPTVENGPKYQFLEVQGEGICEVPVGPVHAGIIEPGHFRFSMLGEEIVNLEPRLGWVHKGTEKVFEHIAWEKKPALAEQISGDTSFTHALAFCQAVEEIAGVDVPARGKTLRSIYSELERMANHCGDLGAIMIDTGFNFGGSQGARLRERVMQLNEDLTGHRFLRGACTYGGVTVDLDTEKLVRLVETVSDIGRDAHEVLAVARESLTFQNRVRGTGTIPPGVAAGYGTVGYVARCAGVDVDTRRDFPYAAYEGVEVDVPVYHTADVWARYMVRAHELTVSISLIKTLAAGIAHGAIFTAVPEVLPSNRVGIGIAEGWRGEIATYVATDEKGHITRVSPRDPSFYNWYAIPRAAITGNIIPDFPLINKSFNQSYSGHDK